MLTWVYCEGLPAMKRSYGGMIRRPDVNTDAESGVHPSTFTVNYDRIPCLHLLKVNQLSKIQCHL